MQASFGDLAIHALPLPLPSALRSSFTLHRFSLRTPHPTLRPLPSALCTLPPALSPDRSSFTLHRFSLRTPHPTLRTLPSSFIVHPSSFFTSHSTPDTLHSALIVHHSSFIVPLCPPHSALCTLYFALIIHHSSFIIHHSSFPSSPSACRAAHDVEHTPQAVFRLSWKQLIFTLTRYYCDVDSPEAAGTAAWC